MGWEGTANDSRVFLDAVGRQENGFPHPNEEVNDIIYVIMKEKNVHQEVQMSYLIIDIHRYEMQRLVPITCCVLHNFIRSQGRGDRMFREYENEDILIDEDGEGRPIPNIDLSPSNVY
ncbi:hypothetical protein Dsin_009686 [Dipteronia sinensis]|uniref:Uncharacterized protein n=1 Tax=Dipteronia sinensis TaxID=43782 RepID=A0AAE0AR36_9ROSI|nr:hypothetical protein Dsin_009686 [Dipteronia sinensis]